MAKKKRTLNELRQVKTFGYKNPSAKDQEVASNDDGWSDIVEKIITKIDNMSDKIDKIITAIDNMK